MLKRFLFFVPALFILLGLGAGLAQAQMVLPAPNYINTVAGNGTPGFAGDGGLAINAEFEAYGGFVVADTSGNIYFADTMNCRVRKVTKATGIISTVAGSGVGAG